ncbi:nucleotidyltransferase domain-containing protein [Candidatus Pyrohabitans sp.]
MTRKREALEKFVRLIKEKYGDEIEKIILFGSFARGENVEESDIDVLIITKVENFKLRREILGLAFDLLMETGEYISAKVISRKDYEKLIKMRTSFIKNIVDEGVVVG